MIFKNFQSIKLSCLGMGNMRLPVQTDVAGNPIDYVKAQEIIDYAYANGINYYDTAYVYHNGESEKFLGVAMKKYPRESYYLATKFLYSANPDYKAVFEEQLSRLQTNYIDFYLIHAVSDDNYQNYINCGCIEYFLEQKKLGKIKYLGFSAHATPEMLEKMASHHQWDFAQIQLNYFDWLYNTAKREYEILEKHKIPVIVMEPVRGGRLAELSSNARTILEKLNPNWTMAEWAFRFIRTLPQVQVVLSGMSSLEQIKENIKTFSDDRVLSDIENSELMKACDAFKNQLQVPCTKCRYCCGDCPANINIPEVLTIYNSFKVNGYDALHELKGIKTDGMPKDCIACGACNNHCPQNIDIKAIMQQINDIYK